MANKQAANTIFTTITCEVCGRPVRAKRWVPDPCTCECGAVYTSGDGWLCGTTNPNTEAMHRILTDAPVKWTKPKRGATYAESEDQP